MKLSFTKMHGAGNDFIIIDDVNFKPEPEIIKKLCDRHFGIGADGILWINKSDRADFSVRYFNSDGTGDMLCINGARCSVLFGHLKNLCNNKCSFEFIGKIFNAEILGQNLVRIFLDYSPEFELNKKIEYKSKTLRVDYFDIGARHIVINWPQFISNYKDIVVEQDFMSFDMVQFGKELRYHTEFLPLGVNVNFINKIEDNLYSIRTYERGVEAETLACGSGSICSAIFVHLKHKISPPIKLKTKSGRILEVSFDADGDNVKNIHLTGPAEKVFDGLIEL